MLFIETYLFTKLVLLYLTEDGYRELQVFLMENPDAGDLIQGAGGLLKLRWGTSTKGKRGGVRIIYYWHKVKEQIYFMTLYSKNEMSDLSTNDKKMLKQMIGEGLL